MPTWVGVLGALSLAVLAAAGVVLAATHLVAARRLEQFARLLEQLAGPAVSDVRQLVATIRTEAEGLAGTSRELRARIVKAADAAEVRLQDLDALLDVVQEEVESAVLDVAATLRGVRRGIALVDWGRRALKRGRGEHRGARSAPRPSRSSRWRCSRERRTPGRRARTSTWASPCSPICTSSRPRSRTCCGRSRTIFCTATSRPTRPWRRSTPPWGAIATPGTWGRRSSTSPPPTRYAPSGTATSPTSPRTA